MLSRRLWYPALVMAALAAGPAGADDRSDALLSRARDQLKKAQSLTMDRTITISLEGKSAGSQTEHLCLLKPGFWSMTRDHGDPMRRLSDGKCTYSSWDKQRRYIKVDALKAETLFQNFGPAVRAFFGTGLILPNQSGKYAGKQMVDAKSYEVVDVLGETPGGIPAQQRLYFGASGLPEIREYRSEIEKGKPMVMQERLSRIVLNPALKPDEFRFRAPAGYTIVDATTAKKP